MTLLTAEQYEESLRRLNLVVYQFGRRVENVVDDPMIRPSMKAVAKTYELAHVPEHEAIMTATSHITGEKINRFTHIHQNVDDLVNKRIVHRFRIPDHRHRSRAAARPRCPGRPRERCWLS